MKKILSPACMAICLSLMTATSIAQLTQPNEEALSRLYSGKVYSPCAERNFPERPLWGVNHLHTSLSMDAGAFGNRLSPREACRFARGEEVICLLVYGTSRLIRLLLSAGSLDADRGWRISAVTRR